MTKGTVVRIGSGGSTTVEIGEGKPLALICGPCVIENRESTLRHAEALAHIATDVGIPLIFKSSYDKANRTSLAGFRGVGLDQGLAILAEVRTQFHLPVVTDVHSIEEARQAGEVVDLVQVPAFLCRQTDLLLAAGQTGKPVFVKKGQFLAPEDTRYIAEKIASTGNSQVLLGERGSSFGYRQLIVDFRSLAIMRATGYPVVFDATHSVQVMGGAGGASSGNREYVALLARAACAVGVNAVFLEAHQQPESALSDGANMIALSMLPQLLRDLKRLHDLTLETRE